MPFGRFFRRLITLPRRDKRHIAGDVDAEIAFHLEMRAEEMRRGGLSPDEARARAGAEFGDVNRARRLLRDEDVGAERQRRNAEWFADAAHDVRFALRQLRRSPMFTTVAVLSLALGTGANTAIMSAVRGVLLRPLPYRDPDALVRIYSVNGRGRRGALSLPDARDLRAGAPSFAGMSSFFETTANLSGAGDPERLQVARVDANWFALLGTEPRVGRTFTAGEDALGVARVAVLASGFWQSHFGADRSIVGRTLTLDGHRVEVIGVVDDDQRFSATTDLWMTTRFSVADQAEDQRGARWIRMIGRLRPGATEAQADADLNRIAMRLVEHDPKHNTGYRAAVVALHESMIGDVRRPFYVLLGAVALVMLVACLNVAALLLARTTGRDTELAVRTAIGAGRGRIVRQLLTEAGVLAVFGGLAGFVVAIAATRALVRLAPAGTPRLDGVRLDIPMFAFALALTVGTGLLFGLLPALHASARGLHSRLKEATRGAARSTSSRLRQALVVAELSLAIVLLAGAGLLLRSFARLREVDPGFAPRNLSVFTVVLPEVDYGTLASQRRFLSDVLVRLRAIPGVRDVGASFGLPLTETRFSLTFTVAGRPEPAAADEPTGQVRVASTDYFRTMGIPLISGRTFTDQDSYEGPQVVVINQELARRYFPNEDPVGRHIENGWHREGRAFGGEIVGVVGNAKQLGLSAEVPPVYYAAADQWPLDEITFVVRGNTPTAELVPSIRATLRVVDRSLPIFDVGAADDLVRQELSGPRFYLLLLGSFAAAALVLGAVGIYGVVAYTVRQRTREIGVRMALGATSARIVGMVLGEGALLAVAGIGLGVAGALQLSGTLRKMLFDVSPNDTATLVAVSLLLAGVALLACLIPARAAARLSPQRVLRGE